MIYLLGNIGGKRYQSGRESDIARLSLWEENDITLRGKNDITVISLLEEYGSKRDMTMISLLEEE